MTAQLQSRPEAILSEDFTPEDFHPADLAQIIEAGNEAYLTVSRHLRKRYRDAINSCIYCLNEKRGFTQFDLLT